jgi:ribose/xylose/arabinose/galactoside ABC-type transport system permease subunit
MTTIAARRGLQLVDWRGTSASERFVRMVLIFGGSLLVYGCITTQGFFTVANGKAILSTTALVGIVAIGATVVMLGGNLFSITIGTTTAVSAMMFLFALKTGVVSAILLTLLLGLVIGGLQGLVVGSTGANPIIVTLGAGSLQIGLATMLTGGSSVYPPTGDTSFAFLSERLFGLPFPVYVFFGLAVLTEWVMQRTSFGQSIYLLGENRAAAHAAALPITRLTTWAFAIASGCAAITGVLVGAFNESGSLLVSGTFSFDAISAVLVGGSAVTGGRGSITRTVIGALLIGTASDLLLLRGYDSSLQILVRGVIVLIAVIVVHLSTSKNGR